MYVPITVSSIQDDLIVHVFRQLCWAFYCFILPENWPIIPKIILSLLATANVLQHLTNKTQSICMYKPLFLCYVMYNKAFAVCAVMNTSNNWLWVWDYESESLHLNPVISYVWRVEQAGGGKWWIEVFNLMKEKFVILHYIFPFMSIKIQAFFYLI